MIEPRRDLDLGEEPLGAELGAEDLERDLAIQLAVAGEVDDGHPTGAELALDDVPVVECSRDQSGGIVAHGDEGAESRTRAPEPASARREFAPPATFPQVAAPPSRISRSFARALTNPRT